MKSINKMDIDNALGEVFKDYRIKNKLTQEKIAEKLGISVKYISRLENGNAGVKIETLVNYINLLGISPNVIFNKLVINENIKPLLELAEKASNLSNDKINFLISIIDLLDNLDK